MNAKKKTLNSNQNGLVIASTSTNNLSQMVASTSKQIEQQSQINLEEMSLDSCDKEKMEVIKSKQQRSVGFDMFADDDDYETVNYSHEKF